jgi:hypothetical protein
MCPRLDRFQESRSLFYSVNRLLTPFSLFIVPLTPRPRLGGTTPAIFFCWRAGTGTPHMLSYRITEIDSRIIVGTEQEAVLVCTNIDIARRVVADALAPAPKSLRRPATGSAPKASPSSPVSEPR